MAIPNVVMVFRLRSTNVQLDRDRCGNGSSLNSEFLKPIWDRSSTLPRAVSTDIKESLCSSGKYSPHRNSTVTSLKSCHLAGDNHIVLWPARCTTHHGQHPRCSFDNEYNKHVVLLTMRCCTAESVTVSQCWDPFYCFRIYRNRSGSIVYSVLRAEHKGVSDFQISYCYIRFWQRKTYLVSCLNLCMCLFVCECLQWLTTGPQMVPL